MENMVALITALYRWFKLNGERCNPELKIYTEGDNGKWKAQVKYPDWDKNAYVTAWLEAEDELLLENQSGEDLYSLMLTNGFSKEDIINIRYAKGSIKYLKATA